jgi:hypothetical protein
MKKPNLTLEEEIKFKELFDAIVKQAPKDVQKRWFDNDIITWEGDIFTIHSNVQNYLNDKLKGQFKSLVNSLKRRTLL